MNDYKAIEAILEGFQDWCQEDDTHKDHWLPHSKATASLLQLITEARISELERIRGKFNLEAMSFDLTLGEIEYRLAELKGEKNG